MKRTTFSILTAAGMAAFTACEEKRTVIVETKPERTVEAESLTKTLETERVSFSINKFEREPSAENEAAVKKAFAELDGEIAELEGRVASKSGAEREEAAIKLRNLATFRAAENTRYLTLRGTAVVPAEVRIDARTGAEKIEESAKEVGNAIEDAAKEVGDAVRDVVK